MEKPGHANLFQDIIVNLIPALLGSVACAVDVSVYFWRSLEPFELRATITEQKLEDKAWGALILAIVEPYQVQCDAATCQECAAHKQLPINTM